jgi:large subunit ribosomal protein L29
MSGYMAIMRKKELRKMETKDIDKKVGELRLEMAKERANIKIGANVTSPGRIKEIRRTIARANTIKREKINTEEKK